MNQPIEPLPQYPAGAPVPEPSAVPMPPQVRNAVRAMYAGAAAWIMLARACRNGSNWARITGTVLFALATIDTLLGVRAPLAVAVRAWWPVIWLAGLAAVIFLWQGASTAYFKGRRQP